MKRIMLLILISVTAAYAQNKEIFLRANNLYHAGEYEQALATYESMSAKGSAVWINIGNCYYYLDKYAHALVAYKRALRSANVAQYATSVAYQKNIMQQLGIYVEPSIYMQLYNYFMAKTAGISLLVMQLLFLLSWFILFWFLLRINRNRYYHFLAIFFAILVIIGGMVVYGKYKMQTERIAVVAQEEVPALSGPDIRYHAHGVYRYGQEVIIEDQKNEWCKVRHDRTVGWVPLNALLPV